MTEIELTDAYPFHCNPIFMPLVKVSWCFYTFVK